ncbi:transposase [Egibacter rhizosphaerae]|nr:transposase [Egibacter rhizosphaerae]
MRFVQHTHPRPRGSYDDREVLIRGGVGYAVRAFLAQVVGQGCGFSASFEITEAVKTAIKALDERAWEPAIRQDHTLRPGAAVTELTRLIDLREGWPAASRLIIRREPLHPGAQQTIDDLDGCRFTALLTDQPDDDLAVLEQRHRARARAEDRIRTLKDLGIGNLPWGDSDGNAVWLQLALLALNLQVWTQAPTLDGELARAEPNACATSSSTPPRAWPAAPAASPSDSTPTGPGPPGPPP